MSVDPSAGSLAVSIALPELPERAAFGPEIQLAWTAPGADPGLGFGVGFALDVPSLEVTTDWGSPYPAALETGDITARLSLQGQRLQFVNSEEVRGSIRIEYRLEGSEDAVRIFRWRTADLRAASAVGLTWPDRSERSVIGPGGEPQTLQFQGFQVAYPNGRQEIYTEERDMAEGQAVGTGFFPIRFPLRYAISPTGDVTSYEYQLADDHRSYLRRVSFAAGRSEYLFDTAARQGGAPRYAYGFAQGAKYLYTRMQARFDGARTHEWCFVYRAVAETSATLLTHPDCAEVANAEFSADLAASSGTLSRQDRLLGILRYGTAAAPFAGSSPADPTVRFRSSEWTRALLASHPLVYDVAVPDVAGFGPAGGSELLDLNGDGLVDIARWRADNGSTDAYINEGDLERSELLTAGPAVLTALIRDGDTTKRALHFDSDDSTDTATLAGDFDGDGNSDILLVRALSGAGEQVGATLFRGPMDASGQLRAWGSEGAISARFRDFLAYRTRVVDVNGDGKDDLVQAPFTEGRSSWTVLVNLTVGAGAPQFAALSNLTFPFEGGTQWELNHPAYRLADVNQDGLTDLVVVRQDARGTGLCVYENHGTVRAAPPRPEWASYNWSGDAWFGDDMNFDGLPEELLFGERSADSAVCGRGLYLPILGVQNNQNINSFWVIDANGDGYSDLVTIDAASGRELLVWLGHGREGFEAPFRMSIGDAAALSVDPTNTWNTRTLDIDGDGWEEIAVFNPASDSRKMRVIDFNRNGTSNWIEPDLLVGVEEGAGVRHGIQYSTLVDEGIRDRRQSGKGALQSSGVPYTQLVVKRTVREVALLPAQVLDYQYHAPRFDGLYQDFLGFERTDEFLHGDASQPSLGTFSTFVGETDPACQGANSAVDVTTCLRFLADKVALAQSASLSLSTDQAARVAQSWTARVDTLDAASQGYATWSEAPLVAQAVLVSQAEQWSLVPVNAGTALPLFMRRDRQESIACDPDSCQNPARTVTEFGYDALNRTVEARAVRSAVAYPDWTLSLEVPERGQRRTVSYDPDWTAKGVLDTVSGDTLRSERTGELLSSSAVSFEANAPLVKTASTTVLTDPSELPSEVAQLIPAAQERQRSFEYDAFGNVVVERDSLGVVAQYNYDSSGVRLLESSNALGHTTRTCYGSEECSLAAPSGVTIPARSVEPTHTQSPQGEIIASEYDSLHRVTKIVSSIGSELRVTYQDGEERPAESVLVEERSGSNGTEDTWIRRVFAFTRDGLALGAAVEEGSSSSRVLSQSVHNRLGQVAYSAEPYTVSAPLDALWNDPATLPSPACGQGRWACVSYDALGRPSITQAASGKERVTMAYYAWGQREQTEFMDGVSSIQRVRQEISADDEVYAVIDPSGAAWRFEHDERGAFAKVQPPGRPARAVRRNSAGEMVYTEVPGGMRRAWQRDARGRAEQVYTWDSEFSQSETLVNTYDELDRVTSTLATSSRGSDVQSRVTFSYDGGGASNAEPTAIGRLTEATTVDDVAGLAVTDTYVYDARGRVLRSTLECKAAAVSRSYAEEFAYAQDGAVLSYHDPFQNHFELTHNAWGAPTAVGWTTASGVKKSLFSAAEYDPRGQLARYRQTLGRGIVTRELAHDAATGDLVAQLACKGEADCASSADAIQNRTYQRRGDGLVLSEDLGGLGPARSYAYSTRDELNAASLGDRTFSYDYGEAGQTLSVNEGTPRAFTENAESAVLSLPEGYALDSFGRLATTPTMDAIEYDAWSRVRHVVLKNGRTIDYAYDDAGRRVAKLVSGVDPPAFVVYPTADARDDGVEQQSLLSFGEHVAGLLVNGENQLALLDDQRGVVESVVAEDGSLATEWTVTPYGVVDGNGDVAPSLGLHSAELLQRFTGQARDEDSGAVLMGARDYIPELGSFGVPDPYFLASPERCADSPLECDLYSYVAHDPTNYVDETGFSAIKASASAKAQAHRKISRSQYKIKRKASTIRAKIGNGSAAKRGLATGRADTTTYGTRSWQVNAQRDAAVGEVNCPFCTAGGSLRPRQTSTSVATMAHMTEGPLQLSGISTLFRRVSLSDGSYRAFRGYRDAKRFMRRQPIGTRFGIAYRNLSPPLRAHVIAGKRSLLGVVYRDYQARGIPWFRPQGANRDAIFNVFTFDPDGS